MKTINKFKCHLKYIYKINKFKFNKLNLKTDRKIIAYFSLYDKKHDIKPHKNYLIESVDEVKSVYDNKQNNYEIKQILANKPIRVSRGDLLRGKFREEFYPKNYPFSVKQGYKKFTYYSFIQSTCYFILNFITVQVSISALGLNVGIKTSLVISTGLNWALKDGIGQLGNFFR